mgnify:FL=1
MEKTKETSEKKLILIDPPSGWRYGFPKAITQEQYKDITNLKQWCIDNGYPLSEAISYGEYFNIQISGDLSFMEEEIKPNKKQFVEFNEDLFKAYINKFSDLGKRKAIEMLLKNCDFQKAELIKDEFNLKLQITKF